MKDIKISEIVESVMAELKSDPTIPRTADWRRIQSKVRAAASQMDGAKTAQQNETWKWQPDPDGHPTYDSRGGS